ncbi:MAG: LuxR C-terminal-related transcriptional regulator [Acidimicrobiia bacterium]|nr:LuxR C-terminal-related transcriptional regulator [Acidimicrobiia bacterium]
MGIRRRPEPHTTWEHTGRELEARFDELSGEELELLADARFWTDRIDESNDARRAAYRTFVAAGDDESAARCTWRLFYEHYLVGEAVVANGWLERCRRHVESGGDDSLSAGWLGVAEADIALHRGDPDTALSRAGTARRVATARGDADLSAMAMVAEGCAQLDLGREQVGFGLLDEAMVAVINQELEPLFTGWVFCNVIATCYGRCDLRRAAEWSSAAMKWCDTLREGLLWPGLCRVYSVELACLRGEWQAAEVEARRACGELTSHDARYAANAFYLVGELCRLTGAWSEAVEAFTRAHELGFLPQPGLALLRLGQGRTADAVSALRSALAPGPSAPLPRAQLLAAMVEAAVAVSPAQAGAGEADQDEELLDLSREAVAELEDLSRSTGSRLIGALAAGSRGRVLLVAGDARGALGSCREAADRLRELKVPYERARQQELAGLAAQRLGDAETARLELTSALTDFERLGAEPDVARVREVLAGVETDPSSTAGVRSEGPGTIDHLAVAARPPEHETTPLTEREIEVLRLVAAGCTNRDIAERLTLSPHTVARHVSNIRTKLGASSRAAATAVAYGRGLID